MNLNELLKKLSEDKAFAANYEGLELDAWLEQAKKDGCEVTRGEVLTYLAEIKYGELSDDELDAVAGGAYTKNGYLKITMGYCCKHFEYHNPYVPVNHQGPKACYKCKWDGIDGYCINPLNMKKN